MRKPFCSNCKDKVKKNEIGFNKIYNLNKMKFGFFIICKKCFERLTVEEIEKLVKENQKI